MPSASPRSPWLEISFSSTDAARARAGRARSRRCPRRARARARRRAPPRARAARATRRARRGSGRTRPADGRRRRPRSSRAALPRRATCSQRGPRIALLRSVLPFHQRPCSRAPSVALERREASAAADRSSSQFPTSTTCARARSRARRRSARSAARRDAGGPRTARRPSRGRRARSAAATSFTQRMVDATPGNVGDPVRALPGRCRASASSRARAPRDARGCGSRAAHRRRRGGSGRSAARRELGEPRAARTGAIPGSP